jgi:hypothetical protein
MKVLGFETRHYRLRSHFDIPFWNCDHRAYRVAHADPCLMEEFGSILTLVIKSDKNIDDLEARAIASANAVFQYNNTQNSSLVNHMIIPCISMFHTRPISILQGSSHYSAEQCGRDGTVSSLPHHSRAMCCGRQKHIIALWNLNGIAKLPTTCPSALWCLPHSREVLLP